MCRDEDCTLHNKLLYESTGTAPRKDAAATWWERQLVAGGMIFGALFAGLFEWWSIAIYGAAAWLVSLFAWVYVRIRAERRAG